MNGIIAFFVCMIVVVSFYLFDLGCWLIYRWLLIRGNRRKAAHLAR